MPDPVAIPAAARRRILVIDDEPLIGTVIRRMLAADYDVVPVTSAADGLKALREAGPFELVMCDLMMPEMSGMEFYDELRAVNANLADNMVFLTGGAFTADARAFLDRVANERMEKPFDTSALRAMIRSHLPPR